MIIIWLKNKVDVDTDIDIIRLKNNKVDVDTDSDIYQAIYYVLNVFFQLLLFVLLVSIYILNICINTLLYCI